jgi:hypothetical protein
VFVAAAVGDDGDAAAAVELVSVLVLASGAIGDLARNWVPQVSLLLHQPPSLSPSAISMIYSTTLLFIDRITSLSSQATYSTPAAICLIVPPGP